MKLKIERCELTEKYTLGKLYVYDLIKDDWIYIADTIEDKVVDINKNGVFDNGEEKIYGETAIPYGKYKILMDVKSPKFANRVWGKKYNGIVPRLDKVSDFSGVLIHPLNNAKQSLGCIGVGKYIGNGVLVQSMATYYSIMDNWLIPAYNNGDTNITLDII